MNMKGRYRIVVKNSSVRYDFEIRRNITIIKGDSATGKTTLVDMIREYYENGISSGIEITCDKVCAVVEGRDWKAVLVRNKDLLVSTMNRGEDSVKYKNVKAKIQDFMNDFVFVNEILLEEAE